MSYLENHERCRTEYETPEGVYRGEGALVKEEEKDEELIWTRGSLDGFQKEHNAGIGDERLKKACTGSRCRAGEVMLGRVAVFVLHFTPEREIRSSVAIGEETNGVGNRGEKRTGGGDSRATRRSRAERPPRVQLANRTVLRLRKLDPKCKKVLLMTEDGEVIDDAIKNFGKEFHFYYTTIQPRHNDDINRLLKEGN